LLVLTRQLRHSIDFEQITITVMALNINTCYMCDSLATSREHAPPKGFFPSTRRQNLITVTSCDIHNSKKSKDDEYLRLIISSSYDVNELGRMNIFEKAIRAFIYNPHLVKEFFFRGQIYAAFVNGERSMAFTYDHPRFVNAMQHMAKAIFFNHFGTKWDEQLFVVVASGRYSPNQPNYEKQNVRVSVLKSAEFGTPRYGENPDIFFYQFLIDGNPQLGNLKMVFYEGFVVIATPLTAVRSSRNTSGTQ